jgi:hypothetical protein
LEEVGLCFPVCRREPLAFDLQAEEPLVVPFFAELRPVQTKSGWFIDCRISKALKTSVSHNFSSR